MKITDSDIATIEHMHDALLERFGWRLNSPPLKNARDLTARMYTHLKETTS